VLHTPALLAHPIDNSFPSDHSAVAAFLAAMLWFVNVPAAVLATIAALALGVARVYCLLHWPIDIVGGWLIGALPAVVASLLWRARNGSLAHHNRF
jgi:undecaprenyl-diphosphatase